MPYQGEQLSAFVTAGPQRQIPTSAVAAQTTLTILDWAGIITTPRPYACETIEPVSVVGTPLRQIRSGNGCNPKVDP
jgi:hypothetical protein